MTRFLLTCCFLVVALAAQSEPAKFFANNELQQQHSDAFALSEHNKPWLQQAHQQRSAHAHALFNALKNKPELFAQLQNWLSLTFEQRLALLEDVFLIECQLFEMTCPELVINSTLYPTRAVNFVFDIRYPGTGLVYLNPDKLKDMEPYAPLAFLLHETRHAYQFQLANAQHNTLAKGYKASFKAQSTLTGFSFSDFLTLLNEYEAFQFGNEVIGLLTDWQVDMTSMGTFASQFNSDGTLKIDLTRLDTQTQTLLEAYNERAQKQYQLRQK